MRLLDSLLDWVADHLVRIDDAFADFGGDDE